MPLSTKPLCTAIAAVVLSQSISLSTQAAAVSILGTSGLDGIDAAPTQNGTNATDGGAAVAIASDASGTNTAFSLGGAGGEGGSGGNATVPGTSGGNGARGGRGGNATATAISSSATTSVLAEAQALAGGGGAGGAAGAGYPPGISGTPGDAGDGGDAVATANASTTGDGHTVTVSSRAGGGYAGQDYFTSYSHSNGGSAHSEAAGTAAGNSEVNISSVAHGGRGAANRMDIGGQPGTAYSSAAGSNAGNRAVRSEATSYGGEGGGGVAGGQAHAEATGSSTGGGAVTVIASEYGGDGGDALIFPGNVGGAGGDSVMLNQVSGSTSGRLSLTQIAKGGTGGYASNSMGGNGGNASSYFEVTQNASQLIGLTEAHGGRGGEGYSAGSVGGSATAGISLIGTGAVSATAMAWGGENGNSRYPHNVQQGLRGTATISSAYGESTGGGTVSVFAEAQGSTAILEDTVDGNTSGHLSLTQRAITMGSGSAVSHLTKATDRAATLSLSAYAWGGNADAAVTGTNSSGTLTLNATASGANLAEQAGQPLDGSDGTATATGITTGDGRTLNVTSKAYGGEGGTDSQTLTSGRGGDAHSQVTANAMGNSVVTTLSWAQGGSGQLNGGAGDAHAMSTASNAGSASVLSESIAIGGVGVNSSQGGQAHAEAFGSSSGGGAVTVRATQTGGFGGTPGDSVMFNQVSGVTSDQLTLEQTARGGEGGFTSGRAGAAESLLTVVGQSRHLIVNGTAEGGQGRGEMISAVGGNGRVILDVTNTGAITANSKAFGGSPETFTSLIGGHGGSSIADIRATSIGDNAAINVGGFAWGRSGGFSNSAASGGNGGNAASRSEGIALGNSDVSVSDGATAGWGGMSAAGGRGSAGDAHSQAIASNQGNRRVFTLSSADAQANNPIGAAANANAQSISHGGGEAAATAFAQGRTAAAAAQATTEGSGVVRAISAAATTAGGSGAVAWAQTRIGGPAALPTNMYIIDQRATAYAIGQPLAATAATVLQGNANVSENLQKPGSEILGLGFLGTQTGGTQNAMSSQVNFQFDKALLTQPSQHLLIGFTSPLSSGGWDPTDSLSLSIDIGGVSVFEKHYSDGAAAAAALADKTLDLGAWSKLSYTEGSLLDLQLNLSTLTDDPINTMFSISFVIANAPSPVPIPAAVWMLCSGLTLLGGVKYSRRGVQIA